MAINYLLKHYQADVTVGVYGFIFNNEGKVWNKSSNLFETWSNANINLYVLVPPGTNPLDQDGTEGSIWRFNILDASYPIGNYWFRIYEGDVSNHSTNSTPIEGGNEFYFQYDRQGNGRILSPAIYHCDIHYAYDSGTDTDKITFIFFRNGQPVSFSGGVNVSVRERDSEVELDSGSSINLGGGIFKYDISPSVMTQSVPSIISNLATIDGVLRQFHRTLGLGDEMSSGGSYS